MTLNQTIANKGPNKGNDLEKSFTVKILAKIYYKINLMLMKFDIPYHSCHL